MQSKILLLFIVLVAYSSCKTTKNNIETKELPPITIKATEEKKVYRATNTVLNDIKHVKLDVSFDWGKKYLFGKEWITLQPRFYPQTTLFLNARGMQINDVQLTDGKNNIKKLEFSYANDSLTILLDKTYTRDEKYTLFIDYVAKPDELGKLGGSAAINSDKGLYFINADGKDPNKPTQLWTQGETQSNSVWYPTIDSPNQRMTQEIRITVDTSFVTLSNGALVSSVLSDDKKIRTDTWQMSLPHAPYLTMMAVSNYKVVKDKWKNMEVNYYVDPSHEQYAKEIFNHTPEMIQFFSDKLIEYPWEKYAQVIAHDYVSGAMENTTASLFGEFVQKTHRELIDESNDDIVAHELIHQWFGDYVTCESWSNIPLNEGFATYGEYLWNEYKYGRDHADYTGLQDLNGYLSESKYKQENLIRFHYDAREEVFDGHSYAKGGRILHMLRKLVGDDAFFTSLKKYLSDNKFTAVEAHNLRLAFEAVTGQDLNWFFNQWFFASGHPDIEISYNYIDSLKKQEVTIEQKQNLEKTPLYKLPLAIDIYENGKPKRLYITVENKKDIFLFDCLVKPDVVNVDAEKQLLCTKADNHTTEEWFFLFYNTPLYLDRWESFQKISKLVPDNEEAVAAVRKALADAHYSIRNAALKSIDKLTREQKDKLKSLLLQMAQTDVKSSVRNNAVASLAKNFEGTDINEMLLQAVNDSSYNVMGTALTKYVELNPKEGMVLANRFETDNNSNVIITLANIYTEYGDDTNFDYLYSRADLIKGFDAYGFAQTYGKFISKCSPENITKGKEKLVNIATNGSSWFVRGQATNSLKDVTKSIDERIKKLSTETEFDKIKALKTAKEKVEGDITAIKALEKDDRLKKIYGSN
ncbi:MAG TPA: M1 family aminopeptidase [Bacteroidia bacterium]|nr:M1 family aminopeptidase [Bacteroidia bacterium]HNU32517.1 M1 family aminopeptidase [Bacteroidia bacterium]